MYRCYIRLQRFAYNFKESEAKWKEEGTSTLQPGKDKFYCLAQFPYPSGSIHLGHARVYFISDSIARYQRVRGKNVLHPMGWDSFGLPAQNAALQRNISAQIWTQNNIKEMKEQLKSLGIALDWGRQLATHKPNYYKWTQHIFLLMFKRGLTYKKQAQVNWDPVDKTVLANQQVDSNGISWRSGAKVQKKLLNQWFFKITDYADRLLDGLNDLSWPTKVKQMQRGWIGLKQGYQVKFKIVQYAKSNKNQIGVFIDSLDKLVNCKFVVVPSDTDIPSKVGTCINPITQEQIPIILVKQPIYESVQVFAAIPLLDAKRASLAQQFGLDYKKQSQIKSSLKEQDYVKKRIMLLKDWLVSRQRYWGTPIPIIHCPKCGPVPSRIPDILPRTSSITINPLNLHAYKACHCPKCQSLALRQSDTLDTFVDSSWYYLRYLDPNNDKQLISKDKIGWMGVDAYVGGIEHAIMHLLYSRFVYKVLFDEGIVTEQQPFNKLIDQGLVKGKTFKLVSNSKYISPQEASNYKSEQLIQTFQKMSKSKFNGISPITLTNTYGSDALRLALFSVPYDKDIDFTQTEVKHKLDFMNKVYKILPKIKKYQSKKNINEQQVLVYVNKLLKDIELSMQKYSLHVYSARVIQLYNLLKQQVQIKSLEKQTIYKIFNILINVLYPICPHLSQQLSNQADFIKIQRQWPKYLDISTTLLVQTFISIDGKFLKLLKIRKQIVENKEQLINFLKTDKKIASKISTSKSVFLKNTNTGTIVNILCK